MPKKNIFGGKKAKSLKNGGTIQKNREIPLPEEEDDSHIAIIIKNLGDGRFHCQKINQNGIDKQIYVANLSSGTRRKHCKGIIININTYVLMSVREFQKDKTDIIFVYRDPEVNQLIEENFISIINTNELNNSDIIFTESCNNEENIDIGLI
jgi:hypothetical protein